MISKAQTTRRGTGSKMLATLAVLAMAGGIFTVASLALFTDQDVNNNNAFSAGTIDIVTAPASSAVTFLDMAPGDQVTAPLTVTNNGTLDFRYSVTSQTDNDDLAPSLVLTVKSGVATCDDANWGATGTVEYSGIVGSSGTTAILGDPTTGAQAGDRNILAGNNEVLCFNVTLPLATGNAAQSLGSVATFTFDAEQTANN